MIVIQKKRKIDQIKEVEGLKAARYAYFMLGLVAYVTVFYSLFLASGIRFDSYYSGNYCMHLNNERIMIIALSIVLFTVTTLFATGETFRLLGYYRNNYHKDERKQFDFRLTRRNAIVSLPLVGLVGVWLAYYISKGC